MPRNPDEPHPGRTNTSNSDNHSSIVSSPGESGRPKKRSKLTVGVGAWRTPCNATKPVNSYVSPRRGAVWSINYKEQKNNAFTSVSTSDALACIKRCDISIVLGIALSDCRYTTQCHNRLFIVHCSIPTW